jgi:hypothetical protein
MQKVYDDVLIFCPEVKTGGPEALHQLGHRIACHGGTAHMVYYAPFSRIEVEDGILRCHADGSPMPAHFAQYHPQVLTEARLGPGTLVIFPEPLSHLAAASDVSYQRALWWLSLDNGLPQNPGLAEEDYRRRFFADPGLAHFYQSDYARDYLRDSKSVRYHPLSDYTDQDFIHRSLIASENPPIGARGNTICFFPNKGADLAARFIEARPAFRSDVAFVPIGGMSKAQVRDTLFGARLYIDFGHHPGKDRVPREAAIAGAVVLLRAAGAAKHFLDHPLPAEYLFTEDDVASGALYRKVEAILADPDRHFANQRFYRDAILLERERFDLEVRAFFFTGA